MSRETDLLVTRGTRQFTHHLLSRLANRRKAAQPIAGCLAPATTVALTPPPTALARTPGSYILLSDTRTGSRSPDGSLFHAMDRGLLHLEERNFTRIQVGAYCHQLAA